MKPSASSVSLRVDRVRSRRVWLALGAFFGPALGLVVGYFVLGAVAEAKVRERLDAVGAARGLGLTCEHVSLRPWGVRVTGVSVATPAAESGAPQLSGVIDEVLVDVSWSGHPERVRVRGGHVEASGEPEALRERFASHGATSAEASERHELELELDGLAVAWQGAQGSVQATGVGIRQSAEGHRVIAAQHAQASASGFEVQAHGASVELVGSLVQAARIDELLLVKLATAPAPVVAEPVGDHALVMPWPDPRTWRAKLSALAEQASARLTDDASLRVDGLRLELGRELRFGPAPFRIQRREGALAIELAPDTNLLAAGSTALAFHVDIPLGPNAGDPTATLEGGPLPLSLLGFRDGQLFLQHTSVATLQGRGKVILGEPLRVDVSVDLAHVGIQHPRLALAPIEDVSFGVDLRGSISSTRELVVEDAKLRTGELVVQAHGALTGGAAPTQLAGHAVLDIAHVSCEGLHQAVPAALVPRLAEFRFLGDFAFGATLDFDSERLDDLVLDVRQMGTCRAQQTPEWATRHHFQGEFTHTVYDPDGKPRDETTGPGTDRYTAIERISPFMPVAVLTSEDGSFFHHHGWNKNAIRRALIANLKAGRFRQGASTISMQLAKNLFLSRDKTLGRKLEELVLTDYLEQNFDKNEEMELYLNVIEFGPDVYGITQAARYYYGREPDELNLAECMFLTSLLPSPVKRSHQREKKELLGGSRAGVDFLIRAAEKTGKISRAEMEQGLSEPIVFWLGGERPTPRPAVHGSRFEGDDVIEDDPPFLQ